MSHLPDLLAGTLHIHVAFDWGEEIDLEAARRLLPAEARQLPRRRRTPASIGYRPDPLNFPLATPTQACEPLAPLAVTSAEATVFDLGAVSVALHAPFQATPQELSKLAGRLADSSAIVQLARQAVAPLHERLQSAIVRPDPSPLVEEYFVFHFSQHAGLPTWPQLSQEHAAWLAGLVRLEDGPLADSEIADAVRSPLRYTPDDLFLPEWSAAVLIDDDCEETLRTIELANLQLLEYRHIDQRLDDRLADAYRVIHPLTRTWLPPWRTHGRQLRSLGEMRVEANGLFERTGNVLKLVGDPYLARVYRQLASRFYLETWAENIHRALDVLERLYEVMSDQAAKSRAELLELIIIALIAFEIVNSLWNR